MTDIELLSRIELRRHAIGMSKAQLAVRAHIPIATLNRILSGREKRIAFDNVRALAGALGIVIRLGSTMTLEEPELAVEVCKKQAEQKAGRLVRMVQGTMGLEGQAVGDDDLKEMVEQTTCVLMAGSRRKLWSE
jgi:transcriptional regulator with XRE-family HTH domain